MRPSRTDMFRADRGEAGFTMVEVLVAILILAVAAMTVFGLLGAATRNTQRAKATQVALDWAQKELEALRSLKNSELAMTTPPSPAASKLNPAFRVNSGNATYAVNREPATGYQKMVYNGGPVYGAEGTKVIE